MEHKKKTINPYKKNLPSTTPRLVHPGTERSSAKRTTGMTEDSAPNFVQDMLVLERYKDNELNEKDLEDIVENTIALIK